MTKELPRTVVFSLRASVSSICNMACLYCPQYTSMEDHTPDEHRNRGITHDQYMSIFTSLLSALRFSAVSITGGEPTTNPRLPEIAAVARPLTDRLELNTNGLLITTERWARLACWFDRVKLSLDTLDEGLFKEVTQAAGTNPLAKVLHAIDIIIGSGAEVALNCVVSRNTAATLEQLIDFAVGRGVRLHLLDYYFTEERRGNWERQFIPLESLIPSLEGWFGPGEPEPIFGCGFYRYDASRVDGAADGALVRIKTSYSGTMRAPRCENCRHYCQEGMYGLKLSTDGWVTTCPSNDLCDGVLLDPSMGPADVYAALGPLLNDLDNARYEPDSMLKLIDRRNLHLIHE